MAAVLSELCQHKGAGSHRPVIKRQVFLRHAGLGVKLFGLPWHRREKSHRQPVVELRVLADKADAQGVFVGGAHALQRKLAKVQKRQITLGGWDIGAQGLVGGGDLGAVVLESNDVVGHGRKRRRHYPGRGQAANGIHIVIGHQLARARGGKVSDLVLVRRVFGGECVVRVNTLRVLGKRRVWRKQNAGFDLNVVNRLGNLAAWRIVRQRLACFVKVARCGHCTGGAAYQFVGPLEVVVAVRRLVDLVGVRRLVIGIRARWIQVLGGSPAEGHKQGVGLLRMRWVGVIEGVGAGGDRQAHQHSRRKTPAKKREINLATKATANNHK